MRWLSLLAITAMVVPAQDNALPGFNQWMADTLKPYVADLAQEAAGDPHR